MCKISQLAEKNTGQLAIRRAYRTGALFFIIRAYGLAMASLLLKKVNLIFAHICLVLTNSIVRSALVKS